MADHPLAADPPRWSARFRHRVSDGTLRWAPALLRVREYPVERLAVLEERSASALAELGVTAPVAPRLSRRPTERR